MSLRQWLVTLTEPTATVIDLMALLIVAFGTLLAFAGALKLFAGHLRGQPIDGHARRALWLTYGRWLVAALTFQLAADIIESSVAPGWEAIGQLAAVALIRTFLNYFLERDISDVRTREQAQAACGPAAPGPDRAGPAAAGDATPRADAPGPPLLRTSPSEFDHG